MASPPSDAAVSDAPDDDQLPATSAPKRVRKKPNARRAEIIDAAQEVFGSVGYESAGLAEISEAAQVSKGLLYHYFPEGRPALFAAVMEQVLEDLRARLAHATKVPFSPRRRLEHLLATLFGYFDERPEAYRLLFTDSKASRDSLVMATAIAAKVEVTAELASALASIHLSPDELVAASNGILGFAMANIELSLAGQIDAETAWRVTCDYAAAKLDG